MRQFRFGFRRSSVSLGHASRYPLRLTTRTQAETDRLFAPLVAPHLWPKRRQIQIYVRTFFLVFACSPEFRLFRKQVRGCVSSLRENLVSEADRGWVAVRANVRVYAPVRGVHAPHVRFHAKWHARVALVLARRFVRGSQRRPRRVQALEGGGVRLKNLDVVAQPDRFGRELHVALGTVPHSVRGFVHSSRKVVLLFVLPVVLTAKPPESPLRPLPKTLTCLQVERGFRYVVDGSWCPVGNDALRGFL
mmetsp:Transcript_13156/g.32122  ORF Transcript_13156/g.32122 Transcript_13156/m.32122 type:complete len:248 (+) Transcript_13156:608-1351(+)